MKKEVTNRGFSIIHFTDSKGVKCSLQKSSLATEDAIWLGVDDADPKFLGTPEGTGFIRYPIPDEVSLTTQMHLNKEQASELIKALQVFVETGDL